MTPSRYSDPVPLLSGSQKQRSDLCRWDKRHSAPGLGGRSDFLTPYFLISFSFFFTEALRKWVMTAPVNLQNQTWQIDIWPLPEELAVMHSALNARAIAATMRMIR